jgi:alpha-galactosidase
MGARAIVILPLLGLLSAATPASPPETTWTIGNDEVEATLHLSAAGLELDEVRSPRTGRTLGNASAPDSTATINGTTAPLGSTAGGWVLLGVDTSESDTGTTLALSFRSQKAPVVAVRSYACYRGSSAIETWTTFRQSGSGALAISMPAVWQMTIPATVVHYENGLRGDAAGLVVDEAFALRSDALQAGEQLTLDAPNRSTEQFLPMIGGALPNDEFFGGLMWSGSWQMVAQGLGGGQMRITAGFPRPSIAVDSAHPLESPHGFFGFTPGGRGDISAALRGFLMQGVRGGRPFQPLVTDNTWFSYGTDLDARSIMDEMAGAASVGVELFVLDAGWYLGAGRGTDFASGLGSWEVDTRRFPGGLAPLREYAHALGMQFGLWVEPERVNLSTVGRPELAQQTWLASNNGNFGSTTTAQICLASPAARQWVIYRLLRLIDVVQPDYLKWDNNLWVNCTRSGHSHGTTDGNFAHVKGLYEVLQTLRDRYPDMRIENCSQGGNRADFGMLRYTDAAWMDDRTSPARHVRRNLEGLMTFFPPAYLLSFVLNDEERIVDSPDLGLFLRSRMPGILGLTYRSEELTESDRDRLASEIAIYKRLRDVVRGASGSLLTDQVEPEGGPAWDALQEVDRESGDAIIFAFQNDGAVSGVVVRPRQLEPATEYAIATLDGEPLTTATGAELMADGIDIPESFESAARVLLLRPLTRPAPASINRPKRDE